MKNPILSFFGILCVTQAAHTADLSPGSFTYKPPAGYGCFGLHHDPGDSPFSQEGPGCQYLSNDQHSSVIFRLCLVRLPVGNPAPGAFTSSVESALQKRIAAASAGLSNRSAIMIHRQAELPTVSVSGTVRKTADVPLRELLVGMRWVHIQSNLVLKITAVSPHMSAFSSLTNSLVSMQVDRARLLESITPELLAPFAPPDIEFEGKDVVTWLRELIGMSETGPPRLSEDVQRRAADAIKRMSTREFDYLAESLPSVRTDRLLSEAIVLAFKVSSTNAAGTVTKLTRLLAGEENTARNAIRCLGYVGAASVNSLSQALTDKDARVRQNAAAALGEIGPAAGIVVPLLI